MSSEHETDRDEYITIETTEENTDIGSAAEPERQTEEESPQEQQVRRSARERHPPRYYGRSEQTHLADSGDPTTFKEAISSADKAKWIAAMEKEMESLFDNEVWDLVDLPPQQTLVGS